MAGPSGLDDLEAELRRMEEELAALQGAKPAKKEKKARKPKEAPKDDPVATGEPAPAAPEPKKRFSLRRFAKKEEPAPVEVPVAVVPEPPAVVHAPPEAIAALEPRSDPAPIPPQPSFHPSSGRWAREGGAWVFAPPGSAPQVLRRVLDADGNVLREEPAPPDLVPADAAPSVDAPPPVEEERKPLHALAERLGKRKEKSGWFRRKKD